MATLTDDAGARPIPLRVLDQNIPADITELCQWVIWRYRFDDSRGEYTKPPYQINGKGYASSTDRSTWGSFHDALKANQGWGVDGIGIVLTIEMGIVGVDLDHCRDPETGKLEEWAEKIVKRFNSYSEVSPSGAGLRIFLTGTLPEGRRKKGNIEIYSSGRYLTVTGQIFQGVPRTIEARQKQIDDFLAESFADTKNEKKSGTASRGMGNRKLSDYRFSGKHSRQKQRET